MTPEEVRQSYVKALDAAGDPITNVSIRRFTGSGVGRTHVDTPARARVTGYQERELVSTIQQGDRKVIILADDLDTLVPTPNDKVMLRNKMLSIVAVDDSTRRIQGVLIAYEIQARG